MNDLNVLVASPWLALIPAIIFALIGHRRRRTLARVAAVAWLLYVPYELAMKWRLLCSGECNIRVDLVLLYPFLVVLSLVALVTAWLPRRAALDDRER